MLPTSLGEALTALAEDEALVGAFGSTVIDWLTRVKRSEVDRHEQAEDKDAWQAREYFSRF
jgi:glutamine synthetase